jgi:hypothetical protein
MSKKTTPSRPIADRVAPGQGPRDQGPHRDSFDWRTFDPAMLPGGPDATLATELVTYRDHLDELLRHEGQYVVIKGREIAGFFRDRKAAVAAAIAAYGPGPVLVKKIVEREPVRRVGHALL